MVPNTAVREATHGLKLSNDALELKTIGRIVTQTLDYGGEFVIVAGLEDKRWRQVKFPYDIHSVYDGITTLHGRLHYWVRVKKPHFSEDDDSEDESIWDSFGPPNTVICFDPISEKFHMFPVPKAKCDQGENDIVSLGVLNECLSMACLEDDKGGVEILAMRVYGVKESWTSLIFIRNLEINLSYGIVVPFFMTVTGDGELVLIIDYPKEKVVVYDPKNDNMQNILAHGKEVLIHGTISYGELDLAKGVLLE
ncbi:F-box protein CPR1-like [Nicotiana sylvestris]|uniref:F-box protein CPR1-like n=1 Tax=Nicotiana sylvestris TaxID=4096 RepID=UPI00388CA5F2